MAHRSLTAHLVRVPATLWPDVVWAWTDAPGTRYAATVLADSPVAYWRCDTSASGVVADASGNSRTATLVGNASPTGGALADDPDGAFYLDGLTGYLTRSDDALNIRTGSKTWELWFRSGDLTDTQVLWCKCDAVFANGVFMFLDASGLINVWIDFAGSPVLGSSSPVDGLNNQRWHYLCVVLDRAKALLTVYVDDNPGAAADASALAADLQSAEPLLVGARKIGGESVVSQLLTGHIDEVAVYSTALPAHRVQAHYAAGRAQRFGVVNAPTVSFLGTPARYVIPGAIAPAGAVVVSSAWTAFGTATNVATMAVAAQTLWDARDASAKQGADLSVNSGVLAYRETAAGAAASVTASVSTVLSASFWWLVTHTASRSTLYVDGSSVTGMASQLWTAQNTLRFGQDYAASTVASGWSQRDVVCLGRTASLRDIAILREQNR